VFLLIWVPSIRNCYELLGSLLLESVRNRFGSLLLRNLMDSFGSIL